MASDVPFLAIRPDEQFSTDVKRSAFATINGILTPEESPSRRPSTSAAAMDVSRKGTAVAERLPPSVRFVLALAISMGTRVLLLTTLEPFGGSEFASVKRPLTEPWQVGALFAWKVVELAAAWRSGLDYLDFASLIFLANLPHYYLLKTFFSLSLRSCATAIATEVITTALPFALLLPIDPAHIHPETTTPKTPIDQDKNIRFLMTILGAIVCTVTVWSSIFTWLPTYMVVHFDGIRTLAEAHELQMWSIGLVMLPVGMALTEFLFTPAIASDKAARAADNVQTKFNPATASLGETLAYNLGFGHTGFSDKVKSLTKRTAILAVYQLATSVFRTYGTVEGTELWGALAWSGVWTIGIVLSALGFGWTTN